MSQIDLTKIRVLVVDDQTLVRTLLSQTLRRLDLKSDSILQASDGGSAIRVLDNRKVDLVFCDIEMKPMGGLELLKTLRCGFTVAPSILPFVFLSGHSEKSNIILANQLDADGFVVKPPKPSDVERILMSALTKPRPTKSPLSYLSVKLATEQAHQIEEDHNHGGIDVPLDNLQPGFVLATDLRSKDGFLLLPRGAIISEHQIGMLKSAHDGYGIAQIYITPESIPTPDENP